MKTHQTSKNRNLKQTTFFSLHPATRSSPTKRHSPSKRAFQSDSSDGADDLPIIKLQSNEEPPSKRNVSTNGESSPRPAQKKRKTFVESDSSHSAALSDRNKSPPRKRRLTKGRRIQDSSDDEEVRPRKRTAKVTMRLTDSDEEDILDEVEKDREILFCSLLVNPITSKRCS